MENKWFYNLSNLILPIIIAFSVWFIGATYIVSFTSAMGIHISIGDISIFDMHYIGANFWINHIFKFGSYIILLLTLNVIFTLIINFFLKKLTSKKEKTSNPITLHESLKDRISFIINILLIVSIAYVFSLIFHIFISLASKNANQLALKYLAEYKSCFSNKSSNCQFTTLEYEAFGKKQIIVGFSPYRNQALTAIYGKLNSSNDPKMYTVPNYYHPISSEVI